MKRGDGYPTIPSELSRLPRAAFYPLKLKVDSESEIASHDWRTLRPPSLPPSTPFCLSVAAKSPTYKRDSEADTPSHIPPMHSPKLRRSIAPEEHENLVEQQLLQWRQQSRKRQHDQSSADQGPFEAGRVSISSRASASPSRVPTTSPSTSSKMSSENLSSEVFHQVSVSSSCRPRRIMTMVSEKAAPVMRCPANVRQQEEARDSEPKKVRNLNLGVHRVLHLAWSVEESIDQWLPRC